MIYVIILNIFYKMYWIYYLLLYIFYTIYIVYCMNNRIILYNDRANKNWCESTHKKILTQSYKAMAGEGKENNSNGIWEKDWFWQKCVEREGTSLNKICFTWIITQFLCSMCKWQCYGSYKDLMQGNEGMSHG